MSEYIKFSYEQVATKINSFEGFDQLNDYRDKLRRQRLVGVDSNGISFGNVSVREGVTHSFYITGSSTGGISQLTPADCSRVVEFDLTRNWLRCEGATVASSESLTHGAIYEVEPAAMGVIHSHDLKLWMMLLNQAPTTSRSTAYGTPELAHEVQRLFQSTDVKTKKIFVMAGHEGGIVTFGRSLKEAFDVLMGARNAL